MKFSSKQILIGVAGLLVVFGLVLWASLSGPRAKDKTSVEFITAPKEAKVTINGKSIGKQVSVTQGTYNLEVSYAGFQSYKKSWEVSGSDKLFVPVALSPQSDQAKQIAAQQQKQYALVEQYGGRLQQERGDAFLKDNPIARYLPTRTSYYSLDYTTQNNRFILIVDSYTPLGRQVALQKIRDLGYDPTDYTITFKGLGNPFVSSNLDGE